jgi:asparagine synthase (glutamine-hydrolysing)
MCGIAGWLGHLSNSNQQGLRMAQALRHRGPDAQGIQSWPSACLVHTRLSILDLSPTGSQPMSNEDQTVWTVFNGEIYNHKEIRKSLAARGHIFRGRSDTEVLPHLYEEYGADFVSHLQGMFAVAIFDTRANRLLLARDRFGIKPLFFAPSATCLAFASEINALLSLPDVDRRPDRQAIYDYAALLFIPAPETFYVGIKSLQPGELLQAKFDRSAITWTNSFYHRWSIAADESLTLSHASERADELLNNAVSRQLESDVPLGSLLSGGIDSSLVSAAAQSVLRDQLQTFNVRFLEKEYDETWAAVSVADHIGSHHQTLNMDSIRGTWDYVSNLLLHAGQPFADTSLFAASAVCRAMRKHVTVALSGDGGDEGFGGYHLYWQIGRIAQLQRLPDVIWKAGVASLTSLAQLAIVPERLPLRLQDLKDADNTAIVQSLFCWLRQKEHETLCLDKKMLPVRRFFESQWDRSPPLNATRLELLSMHATEANIRLVLPNDFLFKMDTASMKEGLEIRVPMLDEKLFSFGLSLPHNLKVAGRTCKKVLRDIAFRKLPAQVARKEKRGFCIPIDRWVDSEFKDRLRDELLGSSSKLPEYFSADSYAPLVETFCDGRNHAVISRENFYQRIIMLLSVQLALSQKTSPPPSSTIAPIRSLDNCVYKDNQPAIT